MSRIIDHIAYCVHNLEEAIVDLEKKLGVKATVGGKHLTQGTKNALINLGNQCYLEILAIDENNTDIQAPRWMGIDQLKSSKVTRWALKADDINIDSKLLTKFNSNMGKVSGGSRMMTNGKSLQWQIAMPLATPEVDIVPFITDWTKSEAHPTDSLDQACKLLELRLNHPNPEEVKSLFDEMNIFIQINESTTQSIELIIESLNGTIQL